MKSRLSWIENKLENLSYNFREIKSIYNTSVKMLAMVKANAYGHGALGISKHLENIGIDYFGVSCMYEALILRKSGITKPILIFSYIDDESIETAILSNITIIVLNERLLRRVNIIAEKLHKVAKIHVKIDTGMHRIGISPEETISLIQKIATYPSIYLEGIFTHFATADEKDLTFTRIQLNIFSETVTYLNKKKLLPPLIHAANSPASLRLKDSYFTLIRPGKIIYGLYPYNHTPLPFKPKPVLSLKTIIGQIIHIQKGDSVGYNRMFQAKKNMTVATIPLGYGDGFRQGPRNFAEVLIHGRKVPVLGIVSMDHASIDVSDIPPIQENDEVVVIGNQGKESITVEDVAIKLGTTNDEVVTALSDRLTRLYI